MSSRQLKSCLLVYPRRFLPITYGRSSLQFLCVESKLRNLVDELDRSPSPTLLRLSKSEQFHGVQPAAYPFPQQSCP